MLAVPVAQRSVAAEMARDVDELVCLLEPDDLFAIGMWYEHFDQVNDREVQSLLAAAGNPVANASKPKSVVAEA